MVVTQDGSDGYWAPGPGAPFSLGPYATKTVTLVDAGTTKAPPVGSSWLVQAYTADPRALSTSAPQAWRG
jgi:hypothetical protein